MGFFTAATSLNGSQPNLARCLAVSWTGTLYVHFWGLLPCNEILPGAKFTMRPRLAFSYIGSVTARHLSSGHQRNFATLSRGCHLYSAGRPSRWAHTFWFAYGVADGTATSFSRFIKIQICLTFLVPAYPDCLEKLAIKWVFVFDGCCISWHYSIAFEILLFICSWWWELLCLHKLIISTEFVIVWRFEFSDCLMQASFHK